MNRPGRTDLAVYTASVGAGVMIANQVGVKATRDALFLSNFDISLLPWMLMGAAAFSILMVVWASHAMIRWGPARVVPVVFFASAALLVAEWAAAYSSPRLVAVVVYLHVAAFGSFLVSGFWSIVNERFDPRTAKRKIGLIAGGGTLGGLFGGLLAERVGAMLAVEAMLPLLAAMHLACGVLVRCIHVSESTAPPAPVRRPRTLKASGLGVLVRTPYLRSIGVLVLATASSATLLDYVFKAYAFEAFDQGEELMRFFAVFYAGVGLVTFLTQTLLSRIVLENFGLGRTVGILPSATAVGGLIMLFVPGLPAGSLVRGTESAVRSSLYRSAYELLYMPVPIERKRAVKPFVDVGLEGVADGFGAVLARLLLLLGPVLALPAMIVAAVVLAGIGLLTSHQLGRGYVEALKDRLVGRAEELDMPEAVGPADSAVMRTLGDLDISRLGGRAASGVRSAAAKPLKPSRRALPDRDPVTETMGDLRSGVRERVRTRLRDPGIQPIVAGQVISLLAWDDVSADAVAALQRLSGKLVGALTDALVDPQSDFAIRRRIPRVLAVCDSPRAVDGLVMALDDRRFEVRYQSAVALERIHQRRAGGDVPEARVTAAILTELKVDKMGWRNRQLLDKDESRDLGRLLEDRKDLSLEHVFRLLGLFVDREPLGIALQGLYTDDPHLRGTALEYLESVLPPRIRHRLWPFLEDRPPRKQQLRQALELRSELLQSRQSIEINLESLRKKRS